MGQPGLTKRRGSYGFDAPYVVVFLATGGLCSLIINVVRVATGTPLLWAGPFFIGGFATLTIVAGFVYTTRLGKFAVWQDLLQELELRGDERVLDLGCGRGAVLTAAATLVPRGRTVGIDLWRTGDQSGNSIDAARRNAELEGVTDRVELCTGDLRDLPFGDDSFDLVLSSMAIHNISGAAGRQRAVDEAVRVLRPGGRLLVADFRSVTAYRDRLWQRGMVDITTRTLDWRFWYGGPWSATKLVVATKPS